LVKPEQWRAAYWHIELAWNTVMGICRFIWPAPPLGRQEARHQAAIARGTGLLAIKTPANLAAVAIIAATALNTPASAETAVKFSLDFKIEGPAAPFLIGIDKGYYKAADLDVTVDPGVSSADTIHRLATGNYDMVVADINALIRYRVHHPEPMKAVFMVYNRPPFAIIARKSRGISTPKDLEGKKLGAPAADTTFALWNAFAKANDINPSKVAIEDVGFPVREPMLAAGQVDAITGYSFVSYVDLKDAGVPADDLVLMLMADYGINLYGNAVIVSPQFAAAHPDAVTGFLRAFVRGLREAARDPAAAIESVLKRSDGKKDVELERLRMAFKDNILTPEVKANGYGAVDMTRVEQSIDLAALPHESKPKLTAEDVFDATFLPPLSDRKAN
jgi:NitT/TauT family transport system substrate-binding protein